MYDSSNSLHAAWRGCYHRLRRFTLTPYWRGFLAGLTLVNSFTALVASAITLLRR